MFGHLVFQRGAAVRKSTRPSFKVARRSMVTPSSPVKAQAEYVDPIQVFDQIDVNKDGVLSREEFKTAMASLAYDDLVKVKMSVARNELSSSAASVDLAKGKYRTLPELMSHRLSTTLEVTVSKLFPAGFGWQTASVIAGNAGYEATETGFFLATGLGDFTGVLIGHSTFCFLKKMTYDGTINMTNQIHTGIMLGTAAFFSGTAWQPIVNTCQALDLSFNRTALITTAVCGAAFFTGLRVARLIYSPVMSGVEGPTYANLKADVGLSIAIGGATGAFVGTDISFADNWLRPIVGIEENASDVMGAITAGTSTALGFTVFQMIENVVVLPEKCWVD